MADLQRTMNLIAGTSGLDTQAAAQELWKQLGERPLQQFVNQSVVRRVEATSNLTLPAVNAPTWSDIDPGGSAAARPLDLVIPNVSPGQWVSASVTAFSASVATAFYVDFQTIVDGVAVNRFGNEVSGCMCWFITASANAILTGTQHYQLTEDDIEDGSVRLRLRSARASGTAARALAVLGGFQVALEGRGPFV